MTTNHYVWGGATLAFSALLHGAYSKGSDLFGKPTVAEAVRSIQLVLLTPDQVPHGEPTPVFRQGLLFDRTQDIAERIWDGLPEGRSVRYEYPLRFAEKLEPVDYVALAELTVKLANTITYLAYRPGLLNRRSFQIAYGAGVLCLTKRRAWRSPESSLGLADLGHYLSEYADVLDMLQWHQQVSAEVLIGLRPTGQE